MKKIKYILVLLSFIILILFLLYANPSEIITKIHKSNPKYILFAFILSNFSAILRVIKWNILLPKTNFFDLLPVQIFGIFVSNLTPGKIGEPIKSILLKMKNKIPVSYTLPSVILERVIDLIILIILSAFGIYFLFINSEYVILGIISILSFSIIIFLLILFLYKKSVGLGIIKLFKKFESLFRLKQSFIKVDKRFLDLFYEYKTISKIRIFYCFIITLLTWILDGFIFYFSLLSIYPIHISPFIFSYVLALATLLSLLSALPGGIGGTEAVMTLLIIYLGIEKSIAASTVILGRFLTLGYSMILGYISFLYLSRFINIKNINISNFSIQ